MLCVTGGSATMDGRTLLVPQVTVNGTTVMFSGSTGNVTGLSLMNGVTYSVNVVARNSVGASETFTGMLFVPCEWGLPMVCGVCTFRITAPPPPPTPPSFPSPPLPLQSLPTSLCLQWQ